MKYLMMKIQLTQKKSCGSLMNVTTEHFKVLINFRLRMNLVKTKSIYGEGVIKLNHHLLKKTQNTIPT